jgi:hypothetical protein
VSVVSRLKNPSLTRRGLNPPLEVDLTGEINKGS